MMTLYGRWIIRIHWKTYNFRFDELKSSKQAHFIESTSDQH